MKGSFPLFVAHNPIKTLIRVMHRNFTLQVRFFWVLLENSAGLRSESVLCPGQSLKPSGEQSWSLLLWKKSRKIFQHCYPSCSAGNNYQSSNFFLFPPPLNHSAILSRNFWFSILPEKWGTLDLVWLQGPKSALCVCFWLDLKPYPLGKRR